MQYDKKTERKTITVGGVQLSAIAPFKEGHPLTATEAAVLNQTLAENLRNNFAANVNKAVEDAKGDATKVDATKLQQAFDEYTSGYEFGVRRGGGFTGDPVLREARNIAKEMAKELLKAKGHKLADVSTETWETLIEKILEKKPEIHKVAAKRVAERKAISATGLDLDSLAA